MPLPDHYPIHDGSRYPDGGSFQAEREVPDPLPYTGIPITNALGHFEGLASPSPAVQEIPEVYSGRTVH